MLYIKIGDNKYPADFESFTTQFGNTAIRVISDAPTAEGFLIVDEEDKVVSDKSDFVYLYREDERCKEYTQVEEEPIPTQSFYVGDVPISPIQRQINALNNRVSDITPYKATLTAYFGETEKVFYGVPQGNVSVFCDADNTFTRIEDRLIVRFSDTLTDKTEITIMVQ